MTPRLGLLIMCVRLEQHRCMMLMPRVQGCIAFHFPPQAEQICTDLAKVLVVDHNWLFAMHPYLSFFLRAGQGSTTTLILQLQVSLLL